jgi:hypothetical protein
MLRDHWTDAGHAMKWALTADAAAVDPTTRSQIGRIMTARGGVPTGHHLDVRAQASMILRTAQEALHDQPVALLLITGRLTPHESVRVATAKAIWDQLPDADDVGQAPAIEVAYRWMLRAQDRDYARRQQRIDGRGGINRDQIGLDYDIPCREFRKWVEAAERALDRLEAVALDMCEKMFRKKRWVGVVEH